MKKLLTKLTVLSLVTALLSGCGQAEKTPAAEATPIPAAEPSPAAASIQKEPEMKKDLPAIDEALDFGSALTEFIEKSGYENKNYMISPTSFRAALLLAAAGAGTETKEQLLGVMDFKDMEEANAWYASVADSVHSFAAGMEQEKERVQNLREEYGEKGEDPDGAFQLENSVWRNTRAQGELRDDYCKYVKEHYGAEAANVAPDEITDTVNGWINKNTNGLIPRISNDLSSADLLLVNTLYLRTAWKDSFREAATQEEDFTAFDGHTVRKDFMQKQDRYLYYEDENGKFVVLPMQGGINAVFILGEIDHVTDKLSQASYEEVMIKLPKFETETSLDQKELIDFCRVRGCELPFGSNADFSAMSDFQPLFISDILQKTKIKTDEKGIEAAAATVIMMFEGAAMFEEPKIKEFTADHPFRFMILTDSDSPEPLFLGRIAE